MTSSDAASSSGTAPSLFTAGISDDDAQVDRTGRRKQSWSSDGYDVDASALSHHAHVTGVAGYHGDMIRLRTLDRGPEMRIGDGNSGAFPYGGCGIGVLCAEGDVRYPQLVDERPGRIGPIPASFHPHGGGYRDTDREGSRLAPGHDLDMGDQATVFRMPGADRRRRLRDIRAGPGR